MARRACSAWSTSAGSTAVHQPPVHLAGGVAQHRQDRDGDQQADDGVGPAPADRDAAGAEQDGQGGEAVGAGVQAVGDQRGGADLAAGADAVAGHPLVAGEADQRGGGDRPQVGDVAGVQQPVDGLVGGQCGGGGDGQHDDDPGQVLGAAVAVGVAAVRARRPMTNAMPSGTAVSASAALWMVSPSSATDPDSATTTAWITVHAQDGQGHPQRAHALACWPPCRVDLIGGLVRMRAQQVPHPGSQPGSRVRMLMPAAVVMPGGRGMRVVHDPQHAGQTLLQHLAHSDAQAPANASQAGWITPQPRVAQC